MANEQSTKLKISLWQKRVPPVRNEKFRGSQTEADRRKKMRNTEDDDTDEEVEDIDLDHYKDDPRLKIFGNPTVKKTQSFSHKKGTPVYEAIVSGCQTPSNTPHSSSPLSSSPLSSPALNPRQMAVALALQQRGLSKSESCSGIKPTKTTGGSKPRSDSPLVLGFVRPEIRPTIVLTSPQESPEIGETPFITLDLRLMRSTTKGG